MKDYFRIRGKGVSPGISVGEIQLTEKIVFTSRQEKISFDRVEAEMKRLQMAIKLTRKQIVKIRDKIGKKLGDEHSFIFESHLLLLEDKSLNSTLEKLIIVEMFSVECAISMVHEKYMNIFESIEDDYFRQRKLDVSDVLSKLYLNLKPVNKKESDVIGDKILVAHDLQFSR